jgi:hypothetical protein
VNGVPVEKILSVTAVNRYGDTVYLQKNLDDVKHKLSGPPCRFQKKELVKKVLFRRYYKAQLYRKYLLEAKYFEKNKPGGAR